MPSSPRLIITAAAGGCKHKEHKEYNQDHGEDGDPGDTVHVGLRGELTVAPGARDIEGIDLLVIQLCIAALVLSQRPPVAIAGHFPVPSVIVHVVQVTLPGVCAVGSVDDHDGNRHHRKHQCRHQQEAATGAGAAPAAVIVVGLTRRSDAHESTHRRRRTSHRERTALCIYIGTIHRFSFPLIKGGVR